MDIKELNEFMRDHGFCNTNNEEDLPKKYVCDLVESALEEGRNMAIDEFAFKMQWIDAESLGIEHVFGELMEEVKEIAKEMKGGVE